MISSMKETIAVPVGRAELAGGESVSLERQSEPPDQARPPLGPQ